jgi:hypothetical protein
MLHSQILSLFDLLDNPQANGLEIKQLFFEYGIEVEVETVRQENGSTDYVKALIPGKNGKLKGGTRPTLGIIGRLGGLGARPDITGFVSDGDGALAVLAVALKIAEMSQRGDQLEGDVWVVTHIDPDAPTKPHDPVPFMSSVLDQEVKNTYEVSPQMDAILSVDTTKGNRIVNHNGIAITPTVKAGYLVRVSEDLLDLYEIVTGNLPVVLPLTTQDITPYGNGLYHINSILQPSTATTVPVVGVAITAETTIAGSATGATTLHRVEEAARFCLETAKSFTEGRVKFYDQKEFDHLYNLYGSMKHLQTKGRV